MIYVVLGMHNSGTTLLAQILHHSGINMGDFDETTSYDQGNKYERQNCLDLNMDLLKASDYEVLSLVADPQLALSVQQQLDMHEIIQKCELEYPVWGFKDPRTCLTYGLWNLKLPRHRIIAVFRRPEQIWPRFKWNGRRKYHTNFYRAYEFLKRWHEYNEGIISAVCQSNEDYCIINYHEFMVKDSGLRELEAFVGRPIEDRRKSNLFRSQFYGDFFLRIADGILSRRHGLSIEKTLSELSQLADEQSAKARS